MVDLMEALKASVAEAKKRKAPADEGAAKPARRDASAAQPAKIASSGLGGCAARVSWLRMSASGCRARR